MQYDPTGYATSFLLLIFIIPIFIFQFYYFKKSNKKKYCICCIQKNNSKKSYLSFLPSIILIIIIAILIKNIFYLRSYKKKGFDPYEILEIQETSNSSQIKKAYFKKLRILKDDNENLKIITKAYNLLKSGTFIPKEYDIVIAIPLIFLEKYKILSIFIYCVLFGIFLPYFVYLQYKNTFFKNRDSINYDTVEKMFFSINNHNSNNSNSKDLVINNNLQIASFHSIEDLLNLSKEFSTFNPRVKIDTKYLKQKIEFSYGVPYKSYSNNKIGKSDNNKIGKINNNKIGKSYRDKSDKINNDTINNYKIGKSIKDKLDIVNKDKINNKLDKSNKSDKNSTIKKEGKIKKEGDSQAWAYLMCHIFRLNNQINHDSKEMQKIIKITLQLLDTIKDLSVACMNKNILFQSIIYKKMVIQCVPDNFYGVMQFPGIEYEDVFLNVNKNKYKNKENRIIDNNKENKILLEEQLIEILKEKGKKTKSMCHSFIKNHLPRKIINCKNIYESESDKIFLMEVEINDLLKESKYNKKYKGNNLNVLIKNEGEKDLKLLNNFGNYIKEDLHNFSNLDLNISFTFLVIFENKIEKYFFNGEFEKKNILLEVMVGKKDVNLVMLLICDGYFGCDVEKKVSIRVKNE